MKDPYLVLGVSPGATDDEIKKAYRTLCRKYHPDVNLDDPKTAEEKFKEVGEAYRAIMDSRSKKESYGYSQSADSNYNASDQRLRSASMYIQRGFYREAINTLNSITERNALWYYLSAIANVHVGNNIMAREYAKTCAAMEPHNAMYQNLNSALNGQSTFYTDYRKTGESYGRDIPADYCIKCCALNIALNLCCHGWCC